jgi:ABC-type branched-subunit amino acid transport system ATPase component
MAHTTQAMVSHPRYVVIDELSLGLAPVVIQRLIPTIRAIAYLLRGARPNGAPSLPAETRSV